MPDLLGLFPKIPCGRMQQLLGMGDDFTDIVGSLGGSSFAARFFCFGFGHTDILPNPFPRGKFPAQHSGPAQSSKSLEANRFSKIPRA
jgi:hypothetical protein